MANVKKNSQFKEMEERLKQGVPAITILAGEDSALSLQVLDNLRAHLGTDIDSAVIMGNEMDPPHFWSEVLNLPLFANRRLFVVQNAQDMLGKMHEDEKELARIVTNIPTDTWLVFVDTRAETPAKTVKLFPGSWYYKQNVVWENQQAEYLDWLCQQRSIKLDGQAHAWLLELTDGKPHLVTMAMDQLMARFPNKTDLFGFDDVSQTVDLPLKYNIFKFMDHVLDGDRVRIWQKIEHLDMGTDSILGILSLFLKELNRIKRARLLEPYSISREEMARALDIPTKSPWFMDKRLRHYSKLAKRYDFDKIRELTEKLNSLQTDCKKGLAWPEQQMKRLQDFCALFPAA